MSSAEKPKAPAMPLDRMPSDVLSNVLSFLPHRDLVSASQVSRRMNVVANHTGVEGSDVTLGTLNREMEGHHLTGLHGASTSDAVSLYRGVRMGMPSNFEQGSKLGPGFYLTQGTRDPEREAADYFAGKRVEKARGARAVFRVFTTDPRVLTIYNHDRDGGPTWVKPTASPPKYMRPDFRGGDAVSSTLGELRGTPKELKIAPHMFSPTVAEGVHKDHHGLLTKDEGALEQEIIDKRSRFSLRILPPVTRDGSLGHEFLDTLARTVRARTTTGRVSQLRHGRGGGMAGRQGSGRNSPTKL